MDKTAMIGHEGRGPRSPRPRQTAPRRARRPRPSAMRRLAAFSALTRLINAAPDSRTVLDAVAEAAATMLGARATHVWVDDPAAGLLRMEGEFGLAGEPEATALAAINEGRIFRFLTKPCAPDNLAAALTAGIAQFRLVTGERELLQKTLNGSIKVLTDVVSLVSPAAFGRASRVRALTRRLSEQLTGTADWQIQLAAMLSPLGCVGLPEETLVKVHRGEPLSGPDQAALLEHPRVGAELLANIPRLERVAAIIRYQEKRYDGSGVPQDGVHGADLPLGARILKVALDFDSLVAAGAGSAKACADLRQRHGWYDATVLEALTHVLKDEIDQDVQYVTVSKLGPDMVLAQDVYSTTGLLLIPQGQEITPLVRLRLANIAAKGGLVEPLRVVLRREVETPA